MAFLAKGKLYLWIQRFKNPLLLWNYTGIMLSYIFKWKKIPFSPFFINVEPNNDCNFKCQHCQVTYWDKQKKHLDETSFSRILDQFPYLEQVKLQGMGEPLLNKQFIPMLNLGHKHGLLMSFISNASLCNQKVAEQLARLKNTSITFSIDGATAETFESIRIGGKFDQIKKNIQNLNRIRNGKKQPYLSVWTVVTDKNIHELPQIVKLASDLGVDDINLQLFLSDWGKNTIKEYNNSIKTDLNSKQLISTLTEAKQVANTNKIELNIKRNDFYSKQKKCPWAWSNTYISSSGDVVPCSILADSDTVKMGNVFEEDFAKIWNSQKYQDFRERIRTHDLPSYCKNCYSD
ncbi:SPASM domain-containing protein [Calothrix sp. CCY 0018]|uniref:radical SAM protein n=1 Tax=Calothrix sp. CCY 0018 TaxID=3103864 RepID=UPI0039C6A519